MRKKVLGFTLIELMIVVAIIAIIAAIAIPGLLRARMSANEGSASSGLRSIASAQASFQKAMTVDQDNDGTGEYGVFNELTGTTSCRSSKPQLKITDLSAALQVGNGISYASKAGYFLQMYLPGSSSAVTDLGPGNTDPIGDESDVQAIDQQENRWICYAWPAAYRSSGVRAFVCDQSAEVYASVNTDSNNSGYFFGANSGNRPDYSTAMVSSDSLSTMSWENISVRDSANAADTNHFWLPAGN